MLTFASRSFAVLVSLAAGDAEVFKYDIPRLVRVLAWTDYIVPPPEDWMRDHAPNCNVDPVWKTAPGAGGIMTNLDYDTSGADVVIFNSYIMKMNPQSLPKTKPAGQLWIAVCWEPVKDCYAPPEVDSLATYDNSSTFPSFFTPPPEAVLRREAPDFGTWTDDGTQLATWVYSHSWIWRDEWHKEISQALFNKGRKILSYGKDQMNMREVKCEGPDAIQIPGSSEVFDSDIGRANRCMARPFALIAETTSSDPWYISEKVWNALENGAVPVYNGVDDVKQVVPPGSTIFARDYDSPTELVDAMLALSKEEAYAWKSRPTSEWGGWAYARQHSRFTLFPRICEAVATQTAPTTSLLAVGPARTHRVFRRHA